MKMPPNSGPLFVVLLCGVCLGSIINLRADAQIQTTNTFSRYQVSAWAVPGTPTSPEPKHGCYILDTSTGALWHRAAAGNPHTVSDKLP